VDEPTEFDKNRGAIFGRRGLAAAKFSLSAAVVGNDKEM
jgi:hypothetical protein